MSNYYGSDLNRFIDERCRRDMTCNNIDCVLLKRSQRRIRIIESKHSKEESKFSQLELLQVLSTMQISGWTVEVFLVRGDYPFNQVIVEPVTNGEPVSLTQEQLIAWLNFETEIQDRTNETKKIKLHELMGESSTTARRPDPI